MSLTPIVVPAPLAWKSHEANYRYSTVEYRIACFPVDRIQAIRLYLRVVDLGSFSKAAADLGIGQPAATKMVAQL